MKKMHRALFVYFHIKENLNLRKKIKENLNLSCSKIGISALIQEGLCAEGLIRGRGGGGVYVE